MPSLNRLNGFARIMVLAWATVVLTCAIAGAAPMRMEELPPELRGWVPWVLHSEGEKTCPVVGEQAVCLWPGKLELELEAQGGKFRQGVFADREVLVPLPGSLEVWPQAVTVDGKAAVVLESEGRPVVKLTAGEQVISGRFEWSRLPDRLSVDRRLALVELSIAGKKALSVHRGEDGSVWLAGGDAAQGQEPERLEVEVFRHLADGVPMRLTTRLSFRVGGRAREVAMPGVLPVGARALGVKGDLPVRLDPEGLLTVQVRPGEHWVEVDSVVAANTDKLTAPRVPGSWPDQEVWVFAPDNRVRQLGISGAPSVDAQRTNLPAEWKGLQAYLVQPGSALFLATERRGEPEAPPNRLTLNRELWLDVDGKGYTVRDVLGGDMRRDHRLVLEAGALGRAVASGEDQLIVRTPQGHSAVELRPTRVDLRAEWRLEKPGHVLPAVGWATDVERLSTTLHLAPGWDLLGATGVDEVSQSWLSQWNLFDVFFVLVVALTIAKLFGARWGAVALLGLALSRGQEGAPYFSWAALLVLTALLLVVPAGKLRWLVRAGWWVTALFLVVTYVEFAVIEARAAFFPATVQRGIADGGLLTRATLGGAPAPMPAAPPPGADSPPELDQDQSQAAPVTQELVDIEEESRDMLVKKPEPLKAKRRQEPLQQYATAVVQTGPGVPTWQWQSWQLSWSGPVERSQEMRLWLLSPWQSGVIGVLRILFLGALAWALLRQPPKKDRPEGGSRVPGWFPRRGAGTVAAVALMLALPTSTARAEEAQAPEVRAPSTELLNQLRERLLPPSVCGNQCLSVSSLSIDAKDRTLRLVAEVHASEATGYQLPGPAQNLMYSTVLIDGRPSQALVRREDGFLHLRVPPGKHEVNLTAPLLFDELVLSLGTLPKRVRVSASGWQVDGVQEDGTVSGSLAFTRLAKAEGAAEEAGGLSSELSPWFEVRRKLVLGVSWSVETEVHRLSPKGQPVVLRLPLLRGEQVTEPGLNVEKGEVVLSLDRDMESLSFVSSLGIQPAIELRAAEGKPWSEHWTLDCGVVWHCEVSGVAPYEHESQRGGEEAARWMPSYRPWPGEKLTVAVQRPEPMPGASVTVDSAKVLLAPGARLTAVELRLRVRNSAGGVQVVEVPEDARNLELTVDGVAQPIKREGTRLSVSLVPGTKELLVKWQEPTGIGWLWRGPEVKLAGGAVNAEVIVEFPRDRWLLRTSAVGSGWGPSVLFWPYLLLVLAAGWFLSRFARSPLRAWEWMLLGLGLSVAPAAVAVTVAAWFFALAFRNRYLPMRPLAHNLVQLGLVFWTLAFLVCLGVVVYSGLVLEPDMAVAGNGSWSGRLVWYADRISSLLPVPTVLSTPLWVWRLVMLGWALWLAFALLNWLRWGWGRFSEGGVFKRTGRKPPPAAEVSPDGSLTPADPAAAP